MVEVPRPATTPTRDSYGPLFVGTSTQEGAGLCLAIAEELAVKKAFTFFVTHFSEMAVLESMYPNVENYFFQVRTSPSDASVPDGQARIEYTRTLQRGIVDQAHYGTA